MAVGDIPDVPPLAVDAVKIPAAGTRHRPRSASREPLLISVIFGVMVLLVAVWIMRGPAPSAGTVTPLSPANAASKPGQAVDNPISRLFPSAPLTQSAEEPVRLVEKSNAELRARVKARVLLLQQVGREARQALTDLEQATAEWSKLTSDVLSNEAGRKLASQSDLVERTEALLEQTGRMRLSAAQLQAQRESLNTLLDVLVVPADNATEVSMPSGQLESDLQTQSREATRLLKEVRADLTSFQGLLAASRDAAPSERSLQEVLADWSKARQQKLVDAQIEARRKAEQAAQLALQKAEQDKRAAEIAAEVAQKNAEAAVSRKAADEQQAAIARKQRIAKRKVEIEQHLRGFTTPGLGQPTSGTMYQKGTKKIPVSLNGLRNLGAFEDSRAGLIKLYYAGSNVNNDRPRWGFDFNEEQVLKAQQLLIELGEDMVAEGLLSR